MSEHYCAYKDGMCELDVDEAYQQGKLDGAREFAEKIKSDIEKYWYQSELDMGAENVNSLIDCVLAEWQKGVKNDRHNT